MKPSTRRSRRWIAVIFVMFFVGIVVTMLTSKALQVRNLPTQTSLVTQKVQNQISPSAPLSSEMNLPTATLGQSAAAPATGPLKQSTVNKRYFADPSGKIVYLTGSHTWSTLQDNGGAYPPPAFDYTAYLDFLQAYKHNFFRLWVWEQSRWTVETADDNYWFYPMPYQRTGPGTALDGQPKFDLAKFNQAYFDRMRSRIIAARDRGIYVSVMLFDGWSIDPTKGTSKERMNPWLGHPFNINNNIQRLNGDPNFDNNGEEIHTLQVPGITDYQKAYIAKVIDTVNDLDNVLYEISNESQSGSSSTAWQHALIDYIHTYESANGREKHPVGMTTQYPDFNNANLTSSHADWVSLKFDRNAPPLVPVDTNQVSLPDTDHMGGIVMDDMPDFIWKCLTRGHNPIYMDPYDSDQYGVGGAYWNTNDIRFVLARQNMGYARTYAEKIGLENAAPSTTLCSTQYCLANLSPSRPRYLVYAPGGGSFTVDLRGTSIDFIEEWFNPATGLKQEGKKVGGGAAGTQFTPPFSGIAVLYLHPYKDLPTVETYLPMVTNQRSGFTIPLHLLPYVLHQPGTQE